LTSPPREPHFGADEYIVKPVNKATLLAAVQRCMNQRKTIGQPRPILVVEDDAPTREFISELLSKQGYLPATAADGAEARASVAASVPELVILDLILPKVSGFQLLAEWRTHYANGRPPNLCADQQGLDAGGVRLHPNPRRAAASKATALAGNSYRPIGGGRFRSISEKS